MPAAISQLQQAQALTEALRGAAETAKAELADLQQQKTLLSNTLTELRKSALLLSAPEGIAQTTAKSLQFSAGDNVMATSGKNTDFSVLKKFTVAAGEAVSLFAQKLGIKLFASQGRVDIQAQGDAMGLEALKDITVSSHEGKDGGQFTAVMAQSPGPLQLLPGLRYGKWWLKIEDGNTRYSLPENDPYEEIYLQRDKWWGLCEERLINPENKAKNRAVMQADWKKYTYLLSYVVRPFIEGLNGYYHSNTYAFYGNSTKHLSYGTVRWVARKDYFNRKGNPELAFNSPIFDPMNAELSDMRSVKYPIKPGSDYSLIQTFAIADPQEPGDGTVPVEGGKFTASGLRSILGAEVDHEGAYNTDDTRFFTLRAIVKIAQSVKQTSLAYPDE